MDRKLNKEVKTIKWCEHVQCHPSMYFSSEIVGPKEIHEAVDFSAKILGVSKLEFLVLDDWNYICADIDWFFSSSLEIKSIAALFGAPHPFPEAPVNSFRTEALCAPFSSDLYTFTHGKVTLIKGAMPAEETIERHLIELAIYARVIGFKVEKYA